MQYVTENITPPLAQDYLKTSTGNRPISKVTVNTYADIMKKGDWMLNGVPIIFDINGHLIDGHHRLLAVIKAGIPIRFDVARGASAEAFTTYDCGRHRNVAQLLAIKGANNYNLIASTIRANARLISNGRLYENNGSPKGAEGIAFTTNSDDYNTYLGDTEGYNHTASVMAKLRSRCRVLPTSWGGGLYYYLTHSGGYTEQEVYPFFDCLYSLDDNSLASAGLLRKIITKEAIEGRKLRPDVLWYYVAKAWNAYITNYPIKALRYYENAETPRLIIRSREMREKEMRREVKRAIGRGEYIPGEIFGDKTARRN